MRIKWRCLLSMIIGTLACPAQTSLSSVKRCCSQRSPVTDVLAGYSLIHLNSRGEVLDFATYEDTTKTYGSPRFTFVVIGLSQVQLKFLNPKPD
ncbi:MAG TPA: hypothetical protein VK638_03625 [Edaphobacter sp.]|nr:hypothetical protein [Edaphobacter sp.]